MTLSDTAEYWNDVKRRSNKRVFTHFPLTNCGHFHVVEARKVEYVDCSACLALYQRGKISIEAAEAMKKAEAAHRRTEKKREQRKRQKMRRRHDRH